MIRLEPESVVEGIVRDPGGLPLPGVRVGIAIGENAPRFNAADVTDTEGRFEVRGLSSGSATLWLKAAEYGQQKRPVEILAHQTTRVDLQMEAGLRYRLRGQIWIDGEGPATGFRIDAVNRVSSSRYPGYSDADGWFEFDELPEGEYALTLLYTPVGLERVDGNHINLTADVLDWQLLLRCREPEPEE